MLQSEVFTIVLEAKGDAQRVLEALGPITERSAKKATSALGLAERALSQLRRVGSSVTGALVGGFQSIGRAVSNLLRSGILRLVAALGGLFVIRRATQDAAGFRTAMAEVSTIVDTATVSMDMLRAGVLELAKAQGLNEQIVSRGLYQAISSGVEAGAASLELLSQASRLAVAGVAETSETVDLLTTAVNSFGGDAEQAERFVDTFFTTVRLGKTTISELASSMGQVLPIAATLGVSLEEVSAAVAAITLGGVNTSEAVTQVRAALVALLSRADDIRGAFADANEEFSISDVRTRGLVQILRDLRTATGGNEEALVGLLGRVEAVNATLALTGTQAASFDRILAQLGSSAGAVGEAFEKQLEDPAKRVQVLFNAIRITLSQTIGERVIQAVARVADELGGVERITETIRAGGELAGAALERVVDLAGAAFGRVQDFVESFGSVDAFVASMAEGFSIVAELIGRAVDELQGVGRAIRDIAAELKGLDFGASLVVADDAEIFQREVVQPRLDELERLQEKLAEVERAQASLSQPFQDSSRGGRARSLPGGRGPIDPARLAELEAERAQILERIGRKQEQIAGLEQQRAVFLGDSARTAERMKTTFDGWVERIRAARDEALKLSEALPGGRRGEVGEGLGVGALVGFTGSEAQAILEGLGRGTPDLTAAIAAQQALLAEAALERRQQAEASALALTQQVELQRILVDLEGERGLRGEAAISLEARRLALARDQLIEQGRGLELTDEQLRVLGQRFDEIAGLRLNALQDQLDGTFNEERLALLRRFTADEERLAEAQRIGFELERERILQRVEATELTREQADELLRLVDALEAESGSNDRAASSGSRTARVFRDELASSIARVGQEAQTAGGLVVQFALDVVRALQRIAAEQAATGLVGFFASLFAPKGTGIGPGGKGSFDPFGDLGGLGPTGKGEKGGLLGGSVQASRGIGSALAAQIARIATPLQSGAVVTGPTLALIGENRNRPEEAVVPLPDGRSIPVQMRGGGGGGGLQIVVPTTIEAIDQRDLAGRLEEIGGRIARIVADQVTLSASFRQGVRTAAGVSPF